MESKDISTNWKKNITRFLVGQTISLFGSSIVQYAIIWYITLATKSGVLITVATLCGFLPQLAISLFAGVWADKYDKKKLIIYSDILIAISTLLLVILFIIGYDEIWLLFVVAAIRSFGAGIQTPSVNATIPQIVPQENLLRINSINASLQSIMMLVSPAVSGVILTSLSIKTTFLIDVVTAIIGILIMTKVSIPYIKKELKDSSHIKELKEGIKYIKSNKSLKAFLFFYTAFSFLIVPAALLTPLLVTRTFGVEVWKLTLNEMSFFAGSVVGGIVLSAWGGFKEKLKTIVLSGYMFGILSVFLGVANILWLYLLVTFIAGVFMPFFNAPAISLIQEETKPELMGRVFSLVQIIGTAVMPLGMVIFGPIADVVSVGLLLIITGILIVIMSFIAQRNHRLLEGK